MSSLGYTNDYYKKYSTPHRKSQDLHQNFDHVLGHNQSGHSSKQLHNQSAHSSHVSAHSSKQLPSQSLPSTSLPHPQRQQLHSQSSHSSQQQLQQSQLTIDSAMEQKKARRETRNRRCVRTLGGLFMSLVLALSIVCFIMPLYAFIQFSFAFGVLEEGGLTYAKPGCWLAMVAGIVSILLCIGFSAGMAIWSPRLMLITYLALLLASFAFITSGGLALYSWSQYGGWGTPPSIQFTQSVVQALTSNYGEVGFDTWTADVDQTQAYFECCGFNNDGWQDYRSSQWFAQSPGAYGYDKPCVPESCCAMNQFGSYNNVDQCQISWDIGPPCQTSGYGNPSVYYSGCLGSLSWVMTQFVVPIGAVALAVGGIILLSVIGFICAICKCKVK